MTNTPARRDRDAWRLEIGDCRDVMAEMTMASIDAIVTDPPYGLGLGGDNGADSLDWDRSDGDRSRPKRHNPRCASCSRRLRGSSRCTCPLPQWDEAPGLRNVDYQRWCETWAGEALRVLRPGGHMFAFAAPRTAHRLTCALEDAGFEIRDQIVWLYASGVPKTPRMPAGWEGWATALKPGHEQIVVARRPLIGTITENLNAHGVGALNVTATRNGDQQLPTATRQPGAGNPLWRSLAAGSTTAARTGRWPTNVLFSHAEHCDPNGASAPDCPGADLPRNGTYFPSFHYSAKADTAERNAGLPDGTVNDHPSVKPLNLVAWLIQLACPPDGVLLDPFTGSGTTLAAALGLDLGIRPIGIENDPQWQSIIEARCHHAAER